MERYAVSIVFTRQDISGLNIHNSLRVVEANSEEEAFGLAYNDCGDIVKTHSLSFKTIVLIVTT